MAKVVNREGRWVADYYDARGRRHREYRATKREATQLLAQRLEQISKGAYRSDGRAILFDPFAREWLDARQSSWSPSTLDLNRMIVERYLLDSEFGLGRFKVSAVDLRAVEQFKASMVAARPNLGPRTTNLTLRILGAILKHAVLHGIRVENPVPNVEKMRQARHEVDPLNPAEITALLEGARIVGPRAFAAIHTALFSGMRRGELLALRWADFDGQSLTVQGTNSHKAHRESFIETGRFTDTKTATSRRRVMLCASAVRALREFRLRAGNPPDESLIFANARGLPLDADNFRRRQWLPALKNSKILEKGNRRGFRFHDLRHTYASRMLAQGAPIEFVSRQLGHSNPATTMRIYRHWIPDRDEQHAEIAELAMLAG